MIQLDSGATGSTYGVTTNYNLVKIRELCMAVPQGARRWNTVLLDKFKHVTVGDTHMYAIADNGRVFKFEELIK